MICSLSNFLKKKLLIPRNNWQQNITKYLNSMFDFTVQIWRSHKLCSCFALSNYRTKESRSHSIWTRYGRVVGDYFTRLLRRRLEAEQVSFVMTAVLISDLAIDMYLYEWATKRYCTVCDNWVGGWVITKSVQNFIHRSIDRSPSFVRLYPQVNRPK